MNRLSIRLYQSGDEPRCREIFDSNNPEYFGDNEREPFLDWLRKSDRDPYWVLEDDGEIVACGGVRVIPEGWGPGLDQVVMRREPDPPKA